MLSQEEIGEIRTQYRQAKDRKKQIGILAELYMVSRKEIRGIVGAKPAARKDGAAVRMDGSIYAQD